MDFSLKDKNILITGSSRGIGLVIAKSFLKEGSKVLLTSRNQKDLEREKQKLLNEYSDQQILIYACDYTRPDLINLLKEYVLNTWSKLDILIVNAGSGASISTPIPDSEHFEKIFTLNFNSVVYTVREFFPLLKETKGNILFISSIAGLEAYGAPTDYSVAKSAVVSFAKNLARKVAHDGVRVNTIAPGNIYFAGGSWEQKHKTDPEAIDKFIETNVPMKRFGKPEEIANAAVFLCSECSSFTTGACLVVDGGQTVSVF